jgi:hypothetical protein
MIAGSEACGCGIGADPDRIASAVLEVVFDSHPTHLSVEEVIREVATDPANVGERCDVADAIRDLAGVGLLHRSGEFVFATRAAVRAAELGI